MVIVIPGLSVTFQPQYTDIPSRLKTMDQAGPMRRRIADGLM